MGLSVDVGALPVTLEEPPRVQRKCSAARHCVLVAVEHLVTCWTHSESVGNGDQTVAGSVTNEDQAERQEYSVRHDQHCQAKRDWNAGELVAGCV
jgi:hypothetical protein